MQKKNGISLIVLVITIIVMVILAGAIILTLNNSGIINKSSEAVFKQNVKNYQSELSLYLAEKLAENPKFDYKKLNATNETTPSIKDMIPSITEQDASEFEVFLGSIKYAGEYATKLKWSEELGIRTNNTPLTEAEYNALYADEIATALKYGQVIDGVYSIKEEYIHDYYSDNGTQGLNNVTDATNFAIPYGTTEIPEDLFTCTVYNVEIPVERIVLPNTVLKISNHAFSMCVNLKEIIIPYGVTTIGSFVFSDSKIKDLIIPDSVTYLESGAFGNCNLTTIKLPEGITRLNSALTQCTVSTTVELPKSLTAITYYEFYMANIESVIIHNNVKTIEFLAFNGSDALKTIYYTGTEEEWNNITIESEEDAEILSNKTIVYNYKVE